jgi:hypothetical protein
VGRSYWGKMFAADYPISGLLWSILIFALCAAWITRPLMTITRTIAAAALAAGLFAGTACGGGTVANQSSSTRLEGAALDCGVSDNVGDGGKTITFDTKGDDDTDGDTRYQLDCVLDHLDVTDLVVARYGSTSALDGTIEAEWGDYNAFWTFHPSYGTQMTIYSDSSGPAPSPTQPPWFEPPTTTTTTTIPLPSAKGPADLATYLDEYWASNFGDQDFGDFWWDNRDYQEDMCDWWSEHPDDDLADEILDSGFEWAGRKFDYSDARRFLQKLGTECSTN